MISEKYRIFVKSKKKKMTKLNNHCRALRLMSMSILFLLFSSIHASGLSAGQTYYLWLNIYEKLLGSSEDGSSPSLSAWGVNSESTSYIFTAEDSGTDGYVLLRQLSSGRYLAASSSSSYNVVFESDKSTDSRFLWKASEGTYSYLINKKNGKYLGVDGANKGSNYVSVYYDKPKGSHSQFSIIPTSDSDWDGARQAYCSGTYTNEQGVVECDYCQIKDNELEINDAVDIHITSNDNPILGNSKINLSSDRSWLIFDNIVPSDVLSNYLKYVQIGGKSAKSGTNCRIAIYLNGSAVIPLPETAMICQGTSGEFSLASGNHSDLKSRSNTMTSFVLRRGYMATVASGTNVGGYSRVYVADHSDLAVTLPTALNKRVSSVIIKPWQYLSKKGWGNKNGGSQGNTLRASWFWSWSAGYSSSTNMEFVPCRQHRYWPSASDVNSKTQSAAFSINEPEHSEQHTSNKCSCGGTISTWTSYTITDDFKAGGGRIGSPQPTDFSYLTEYFNYVDNMANRCDFACTHAYWDISGRSESGYASYFADHCKEVWNSTGRPLWITELEIGSSWGESWSGYSDKYGTYRKYLQVLLQKMEECGWIERYCIYGFDNYWSWMFYNDGGITPAGQVYRDHRSTFAYNSKYTKAPTFWAPSAKSPSLSAKLTDGCHKLTLNISNPNGDMTDRLLVEYQSENSNWEPLYEETDRSKFESNSLILADMPTEGMDLNNTRFRVTVVSLTGTSVVSPSVYASLLDNPDCNNKSSTGWTIKNIDYDTANPWDGDTSNAYWNIWKQGAYTSSLSQTVSGLAPGKYTLSVLVRASTTAELSLNLASGNLSTTQTAIGLGSDAIAGSDLPGGWFEMSTDTLLLDDVSDATVTLDITLPGTGWWSADHFRLSYLEQPKPEFVTGDVDGDGKVNISDVVAVINAIAGTGNYERADVNGDGKTNITDVVDIINIIAGKEPEVLQ